MKAQTGVAHIAFIALFATVILAAGCAGRPSGPEYEKVEIEVPPGRRGPVQTDLATDGFRIARVLWQEKRLTALGIATQHVGDRGVGRLDEGRKRLRSSESGELYIITWTYKGEPVTAPVTVEFRQRLQKQSEPSTATAVFTSVQTGTYAVRFHNIGTHFQDKGKVTAWQARLLVSGKVVAQRSSFLWNLTAMEEGPQAPAGTDAKAPGS